MAVQKGPLSPDQLDDPAAALQPTEQCIPAVRAEESQSPDQNNSDETHDLPKNRPLPGTEPPEVPIDQGPDDEELPTFGSEGGGWSEKYGNPV
jgi:hypothetical protein